MSHSPSFKSLFVLVIALLKGIILQALPHPYYQFQNWDGKTLQLCIRSIVQSDDGMIWLGAEDGLYSFDGYHLQRRSMDFGYDTSVGRDWDMTSLGCLTCMVTDSDSLMIGCERGLISFNLRTYKFRQLPYAQGEHVRGVVRAAGHEWVATQHALYRDGKKMHLELGELYSVGGDDTYLYIGIQEKVMRYDIRRERLDEMLGGIWIATCFAASPQGNVWVGTSQQVIEWDRAEEKELSRHPVPVAKSLCVDQRGNLLMGTDNGLCIAEKNRKVHHIRHDARVGESLAGDAVWCLFRDRDDNIWIGTNSGISMVASEHRLTTYTLPSITGESTGNQLFCMSRDVQGRLWMGGSNGLICVEHLGEENQSFRWYRIDNDRYPITHNRIRAIFTSDYNQVWVGGDGGLFLLNEKTGQLERYELDGDANHWVYDIRHAQQTGVLAVTTFDATYVVQFDQDTHRLEVLRKTSPLYLNTRQQEEASIAARFGLSGNDLSVYYDSLTGNLFLGGTDRFSILHIDEKVHAHQTAPISVTDIKVNGTHLVPHLVISALTATFQPDERVLQFLLSDFDYSDECPNHFYYRITGQDEWMELPSTERTITFTNLSAGTYQLFVRSSNGETDGSLVFTFQIQAPWYATLWAKAMYVLLLIGILYGIYRFIQQRKRLKRERQERTELLARAKEKERELLNDNEYLAAQLRLQLVEKSGDAGELSADEKFLLDITRIIEENMDDSELNVNTLSEKSGISTKQLYRRIKALTGMTTVAYIRDQRMKKAASLLAKGSFTVSEVMYMVGFSSASYFTRCFCDEYGMPPSEYKA